MKKITLHFETDKEKESYSFTLETQEIKHRVYKNTIEIEYSEIAFLTIIGDTEYSKQSDKF